MRIDLFIYFCYFQACQGRNNCRIGVSNDIFGDPCRGTLKTLAVEAECLSPDFATEKLRDAL